MDDAWTYCSNAKQLDASSATFKCTFLAFNLLEAKLVLLCVEVVQAWSCPCLILFRIVLLQTSHILLHLLQNLTLEVRGLTRAHLAFWTILCALESRSRGRGGFEFAFLCRCGRGRNVSSCVCSFTKDAFRGYSCRRHGEDGGWEKGLRLGLNVNNQENVEH